MDSLMPQPPQNTQQLARELLEALKLEEKKRRNRPLLIAWSLRMEIGLHRDLQQLAKASGYSMTAIFCTALKLMLPTLKAALMGQRPLTPERPQPVERRLPSSPPPPVPAMSLRWQSSASTFSPNE